MLDERFSKALQLVLAITAAVALLFQCDLAGSALLLFLVIPALALFAAVYLLALDAMVAKLRGRPAGHLKTALVLAFALGPALPWVNIPFQWISAAHKLLRNQSRYADLVRRAEAGEAVRGFYVDEPRLPRRYSFVWGGIADNWIGIVHDASQTFGAAPDDVFGGDLVGRLHLWGPWYFVHFT